MDFEILDSDLDPETVEFTEEELELLELQIEFFLQDWDSVD